MSNTTWGLPDMNSAKMETVFEQPELEVRYWVIKIKLTDDILPSIHCKFAIGSVVKHMLTE